jgi:hypothetical protein
MRKPFMPYLIGKPINEKSIWWLILKGFGGAIALAISVIIAWAAVGTFNVSNSIRLSEQLNRRSLENDSLINEIRTLNDRLSVFESERFILTNGGVHTISDDIFICYEGWPAWESFEIKSIDTSFVKFDDLPVNKLIKINTESGNFLFIIENVYRKSYTSIIDSILIYWHRIG